MNFYVYNFPFAQILLLSSVRIVTICDANLTIPSPDPCLLFDPDCDRTAAAVSLKFIHFTFLFSLRILVHTVYDLECQTYFDDNCFASSVYLRNFECGLSSKLAPEVDDCEAFDVD